MPPVLFPLNKFGLVPVWSTGRSYAKAAEWALGKKLGTGQGELHSSRGQDSPETPASHQGRPSCLGGNGTTGSFLECKDVSSHQ